MCLQIFDDKFKDIIFSTDAGWLMKLTGDGKILFNKKKFPDMAANDFAEEVVKILEKIKLRFE